MRIFVPFEDWSAGPEYAGAALVPYRCGMRLSIPRGEVEAGLARWREAQGAGSVSTSPSASESERPTPAPSSST